MTPPLQEQPPHPEPPRRHPSQELLDALLELTERLLHEVHAGLLE